MTGLRPIGTIEPKPGAESRTRRKMIHARLREEDYLDWLENAARLSGEMVLTDAAVFAACVSLGMAAFAALWMARR